jgi:hypothetical protein
MAVTRQQLSKQAMKLRHPASFPQLNEAQRELLGESSDLLLQAGQEIEELVTCLKQVLELPRPDTATELAREMWKQHSQE